MPPMRAQHLLGAAAAIVLVVTACAAYPAADGYRVGVNTAYFANLRQETIRGWVRETGAASPRVGMRMDLFQKGMPDHADAWVIDAAASGGSPIAMLFNEHQQVTKPDGSRDEGCRPPAGLWEPVFDNASDVPAANAKVNPKNEWAAFVAAMAERYDGDGVGDATGSPVVTWFSIWNEPDWRPWPERPKDPADKTMRNWSGHTMSDLARVAFVSHRAARFAHPRAKVGMQLCFHETLGMLLDDPKHPLAKNCDFIDFHAYGGKGSDDNCFRNDGIVPVWRQMKGEYNNRGLPPPQFLCTETGVGGGPPGGDRGTTQAAAVIKANVVGASIGLVTVCWYALVDPSWENMGLIGDASRLAPDGTGAEKRDAYTAIRTASLLLNGATQFEEVAVGPASHAYRYRDRDGRQVLVTWADDGKGANAGAIVRLPLDTGPWERIEWDFAETRAPKHNIPHASRDTDLTVTPMPIFLRQVR